MVVDAVAVVAVVVDVVVVVVVVLVVVRYLCWDSLLLLGFVVVAAVGTDNCTIVRILRSTPRFYSCCLPASFSPNTRQARLDVFGKYA